MENTGEPLRLEVRSVTTQNPFKNKETQAFFQEWCKINDSIEPEFLDRAEWEERSTTGILEKTDTGKHKLLIPQDLKLWEMVGVMEAVDQNTFTHNPERQLEKKDALLALGGLFEKAGVYIAKRLDTINEGKPIAEALAEELYEYGFSLKTGKRPETPFRIEDIRTHQLTAEDTDQVDRFLAGDALYESRKARAEKLASQNPEKRVEYYELERQRTLGQFFKAAEKSSDFREQADEAIKKTTVATSNLGKVTTRFTAPSSTKSIIPSKSPSKHPNKN